MSVAAPSKFKLSPVSRQFNGSILRSTVAWLLIMTLIPVIVTGAVTYLRTRTLLREQTSTQMQLLVDSYLRDLDDFASVRLKGVEKLATSSAFWVELHTITNPDVAELGKIDAKMRMLRVFNNFLSSSPETIFDELTILDEQGNVLLSTNTIRNQKSYSNEPIMMALLGVDKVGLEYKAQPVFKNEFTWTATHVYLHPETGKKYTLMGAIAAPDMAEILKQVTMQLPGASAYFILDDNRAVHLNDAQEADEIVLHAGQRETLQAVRASEGQTLDREYFDEANVAMLSYTRYNPNLGISLLLDMPKTVVYSQLSAMLSSYALMLLGAILLTGTLILFGVRRLVTPLTGLVGVVRGFSQGKWEERALVNREDEIGMLSHAFNLMAEELSKTYQMLESKVEERNRQLQTAAEIAQTVSSSGSRDDIMKQTVALILEQFHCDNTTIYLLDSTHTHFAAVESGGRLNAEEKKQILNQRIRTYSIFGQAITANQIRILHDQKNDGEERAETLLPGQMAEVIIPISVGGQVLGLLDAQSPQPGFFDDELVAVLKMLADQVANGIQNVNLIESAQIDLQETSLVYRASREISQATSKEEITRVMLDLIEKTAYTGLLMEMVDNEMVAVAMAGADKPSLPPQRVAVSLARTRQFLNQRSYAIIENIAYPSDFFSAFTLLIQYHCKSAVIFPVQTGENLREMFILGSRSDTALTDTSVQPYVNLAEVIQNTQKRLAVQTELEQNVNDLRTLATISQAVSAETQLDRVFPLLREQITAAFGGNIEFLIALYHEKTGMIEIPYMIEQGEKINIPPFPLGQGITSYVIKTRQPLLLSRDVEKQSAALGAKMVGLPAKSWAGVPLLMGSDVIGALVVEDTEQEGRFGERDMNLLATLAPQVAISVRNAQLVTEMQSALHAYDQERFLLNTLLENIPDQVYFKDRQGKYIRTSASLAARHGLSTPDALVGKAENEIDPSQEGQEKHALDEAAMRSKDAVSGSVEAMPGMQGSEGWALVSRLPMFADGGDVAGLLGIYRDITEMKKAEDLAQKRARQVRTAAEIARDTSGTLNLAELLEKSVNLVRDRFGFYHASIFLVDALGEYAVLRESTGEAGAQLKNAGHRLAVGSQSIVGQAVYQGEALVVNDVTREANYYPNPLLPMTRSELAIPLKAGETITGAIDVQSTQVEAFDAEDINILRILADQLAGAILNADLYAQTEANVAKHRFLHQITTAASACTNLEDALATTVQGLTTALFGDRVAVYLYNAKGMLEIRASSGYSEQDLSRLRFADNSGAIGLAALGRRTILVKDTLNDSRYQQADERVRSQLTVPILYSDTAMGVLCIESMRVASFDENDQEIIGSLGNNLGAILSNARLVSQVTQQVEQQKQLFEITNRIRRAADMDAILQTSAREICRVVQARRAHIQIGQGSPREAEDLAANPFEQAVTARNGHNGHNGHNGNGHSNNGSREAQS